MKKVIHREIYTMKAEGPIYVLINYIPPWGTWNLIIATFYHFRYNTFSLLLSLHAHNLFRRFIWFLQTVYYQAEKEETYTGDQEGKDQIVSFCVYGNNQDCILAIKQSDVRRKSMNIQSPHCISI
jgi:hypothetical protein